MTIQSTLEKTGNNNFFIPIPPEAGNALMAKFGKRVICYINGSKIHCAILNNQRLGMYIMIGKSTHEKIKARHKDKLQLQFSKDTTPYQMEVSEAFSEVLLTDPEGAAAFNQLTDGKKRSLIHYVNKAKQEDTRINRAIKIMENLKLGFTDLKDLLRSK